MVMATQNPLEHHGTGPLPETLSTFGHAFGGEAWTTHAKMRRRTLQQKCAVPSERNRL